MLEIHFRTDLNAEVTIKVEDESQLMQVQRKYGQKGWSSGEVPSGGYLFPLENEANFDWSLIGARKWKTPEGEEVIFHRGHAYKRRELEEVDSKKMKLPKAIKYSRGAKPTDPSSIREKSDGEIEYVALALFKGKGYRPEYDVPGSSNNGTTSNASSHSTDAPAGSRGHLMNSVLQISRDQKISITEIAKKYGKKTMTDMTEEELKSVIQKYGTQENS